MASHSLAASEMDTIKVEIGETASKIKEIEGEVAEVKGALQGSGTYLGITDRQQLLDRLGALEKEKEQLRKEKEQLREKELRLLPAPSPPATSGAQHFLVEAIIKDAQRMTGIRALMYVRAEEGLAFYASPSKDCMWYEGGDLRIRVAFKSEEAALKFQTFLRSANTGYPPYSLLSGKVSFIEEGIVVGNDSIGGPVLRGHYDGSSSMSPGDSLEQIAVKSRGSPEPSLVGTQDPLFLYQSIEKPEWANGYPFEKAHIKDRALCSKEEVSDVNNLLTLTPTLHKYFDGCSGRGGSVPAIAMRAGDVLGVLEELPYTAGKKRQQVEVFLECRELSTGNLVLSLLKSHTTKLSDTSFKTSVHVENPSSFKIYMGWKYKRTKESWL